MKVNFRSHRSQRQSAKQQKPACRCILTVRANSHLCWMKASSCRSMKLTVSTRLRYFTESEFVAFVYKKLNGKGPILVRRALK